MSKEPAYVVIGKDKMNHIICRLPAEDAVVMVKSYEPAGATYAQLGDEKWSIAWVYADDFEPNGGSQWEEVLWDLKRAHMKGGAT